MSLMNYLVKLNLSNNLLTNVDGLGGLTRLIDLNLSKNKMFVHQTLFDLYFLFYLIEMIYQPCGHFYILSHLISPPILYDQSSHCGPWSRCHLLENFLLPIIRSLLQTPNIKVMFFNSCLKFVKLIQFLQAIPQMHLSNRHSVLLVLTLKTSDIFGTL